MTTAPLTLAILQEAWPAWRITRNIYGVAPPGFTAVERPTGRRLTAETLSGLQALLTTEGKPTS